MKDPKDMTREELAESLDALPIEWMDGMFSEAAARLRNSIDRPKVDVRIGVSIDAGVYINDRCVFADPFEKEMVIGLYDDIRIALGMEGGA